MVIFLSELQVAVLHPIKVLYTMLWGLFLGKVGMGWYLVFLFQRRLSRRCCL